VQEPELLKIVSMLCTKHPNEKIIQSAKEIHAKKDPPSGEGRSF
jgi:hypothetical protein